MHELYAAEKGKGATLGGAPIAAGGTAELARAVLASGFPYDMWDTEKRQHRSMAGLSEILRQLPLRRLGRP
jgi:myo-inositol-1(or 4)-monophosphatase